VAATRGGSSGGRGGGGRAARHGQGGRNNLGAFGLGSTGGRARVGKLDVAHGQRGQSAATQTSFFETMRNRNQSGKSAIDIVSFFACCVH
jgi:hypothetical protein